MPAPKPPLSVTGTGELYAVKRTIHLLIKPDNLTCYQQPGEGASRLLKPS
jgi:hypothetical protein